MSPSWPALPCGSVTFAYDQRYNKGVSPGLRDPLGLDGSQPPEDPEAFRRAARTQLRRIQPGLALVVDALRVFRHGKREGPRSPGSADDAPKGGP
jgi:hypothetical protein